jgi:uncharacterized protein (DUF433 family)
MPSCQGLSRQEDGDLFGFTEQDVFEYLAGGMTEDQILEDFPELTREDFNACFAFAADRERKLFVAPA